MALPTSGKTYRFKCAGSNARLNLYSSGTASNGMNVVVFEPDNTREQKWLYSGGRLYIKTDTSYCLDRFTKSPSVDNADIYLASSADASEQLITFEEGERYTNSVKIRLTNKVNNEYYYLTAYNTQNGTGTGKSKTSPGNVFWRTKVDSNLQLWIFEEMPAPSGKYVWPTESHEINLHFGVDGHEGIDIAPLTYGVAGDDIYAFMAGYVSFVGTPATSAKEGYTVRIHHTNPLKSANGHEMIRTQYMHMQKLPRVSVGDYVTAGTLLGYMGSTGNSTGNHLHFEVRGGTATDFPQKGTSGYYTGKVLDPEPYLDLTE